MACGYKTKGCAHAEGCEKTHEECATAKYFDCLVGSSAECRNNLLPARHFVPMWRDREKTDERCVGCKKRTDGGYCSVWPFPAMRWPNGDPSFENKCVLANHVRPEKKKGTFVNPLKASKKGYRR